MQSPKNSTGTGLIRELTDASSRQMTFNLMDPDTLTFDLPGHSQMVADINVRSDDVLVYRDSTVIQRFRVVGRSLSKASGVLTASFSCVSYKGLLDAWIFHDADQKKWTSATEQTAIAWKIVDEGQSRSTAHNLGIGSHTTPSVSINRTLIVDSDTSYVTTPLDYFQSGQARREAIDQLAAMDQGFDWDILPDAANETTALKLNFWTDGDGRRGRTSTLFILDDGGNVASWEVNETPADYGNVLRLTGTEPTTENFVVTGASPATAVWQNSATTTGQNPAGTAPLPVEGAWERDDNNGDWTSKAMVTAAGPMEWRRYHDQFPEITVDLTSGRWNGPADLWLGDNARVIITELVADSSTSYVYYLDTTARVYEVQAAVDDLGSESISLSLGRPTFSTRKDSVALKRRLKKHERR